MCLQSATINDEAVQHVIVLAYSKISFHNFQEEWLWRGRGGKRQVPAGESLAMTLYWRVFAEGLGQPCLEHGWEDRPQSGSQPRKRWRPSSRSVTRVDRIKRYAFFPGSEAPTENHGFLVNLTRTGLTLKYMCSFDKSSHKAAVLCQISCNLTKIFLRNQKNHFWR